MKKVLFTITAIIALSSCSSSNDDLNNNNNQQQQSYLMPLKIGNNWTYNYTTFNESGTQTSSSTVVFKDVLTVTNNGNEYHKISLPSNSTTVQDLAYNMRNLDYNTISGFT